LTEIVDGQLSRGALLQSVGLFSDESNMTGHDPSPL
jgi:hypothetical protein